MSEKKWDTVRLYAIRDQIDRGEEISAEDKEYVREWFEAMKPNLAAFTEAMKRFADAYAKAAAKLGRQLREKARHGNGNGHGKSLAIEAQRLLPTPRVKNNENRQSEQFHGEAGNYYGLLQNPERWGDYAAAIARWESVIGRPAPEPTQTSTKGNPQLSAAFVEWLMGLPAGWVTDVPGITRNEALKALGNGVVIQQAAEALRVMLDRLQAAS